MTFTDSQRALIGEIVEKKLERHALNAKEDNKKLTETTEGMLKTFNDSILKELGKVKIHFRDKIEYMVLH